LVTQRWVDAQYAIGPVPGLTWDIGDYPHFHTPRGYGVTFSEPGWCHIRLGEKILKAHSTRVDGVVRHEIGHVLDALVHHGELERWAGQKGIVLPRTPERRADAIAFCVWGSQLRYDRDLVQNTETGVYPRPAHLGL
jgi:hypothetical protein